MSLRAALHLALHKQSTCCSQAMLHDMGPQERQNAERQAAADMNRQNSGLESMQSIDDALNNVDQGIMDKVANDWVQNHAQGPPQKR